ncbi:MAG: 30S ribosomal protein S4 [Candidatus Omnitrophica bacterium]|nr:30S ribosomal protein S4 [Candidatus Omnitrophota bacterium]
MARYRGPRCRLCRREGESICFCKKCAQTVRRYPPGQHGVLKRSKLSDYGIQLREKQKVKRLYGILEKQFRRYYEKAARKQGVTGSVLLQFLERRLDNVIFRLGFATTRPQARQIVSHGLVKVNGRRVNIPSFQVELGDEIELKIKEKTKKLINTNIEQTNDRGVPEWLMVDEKKHAGKVVKLPERDDVQFPINEQLIVELYSK